MKPVVLKNLCNEIAPLLAVIFQKSLNTGQVPKTGPRHVSSKRGIKVTPLNTAPYHLHAISAKWWNRSRQACPQLDTEWPVKWVHWREVLRGPTCWRAGLEHISRSPEWPYSAGQNDLILLDCSKAFDRVNHRKFLYNLHQHGVRGRTLSWIKAFLIGRSQTVVLEGECSSEIPVTSGVPQGLVLRP